MHRAGWLAPRVATRAPVAAFAAGLVVLLSAGPAEAHKQSVKRALFLEPSGAKELQVIVAIRVPAGQFRRALEVLADQDHDGRLSKTEETRLERLLAERALEGLRLYASTSTGTSTLAVGGVELKLKTDPGPLELMLHGVAHLPRAAGEGGLELAVGTEAIGDPLDLLVLPGNRPVQRASRGDRTRGGLKAALGQGDRVSWRVE